MSWIDAGAKAPDLEARIDAREAELIGKPLRIKPATEAEVTPEMREYISSVNKTFGGAGDAPLSTLYLQMLRHFDLARAQLNMTMQLVTKGVLPPRDREMAILRVMWHCGSPSPYGEHVFMAKYNGITEEEIQRIKQGPDAPGWTAREKALLEGVDQLLANYVVKDETWAIFAKDWTDPQKLEFAVVVGQYMASATYHNVIRTRCSDYNIGLRQG
jgi:4-carboxymuconolactone decarboxylase